MKRVNKQTHNLDKSVTMCAKEIERERETKREESREMCIRVCNVMYGKCDVDMIERKI